MRPTTDPAMPDCSPTAPMAIGDFGPEQRDEVPELPVGVFEIPVRSPPPTAVAAAPPPIAPVAGPPPVATADPPLSPAGPTSPPTPAAGARSDGELVSPPRASANKRA